MKSPIKGSIHASQMKSPVASNERTKRRQSLTGISSGPSNSRRSSLGGKPDPVACKLKRQNYNFLFLSNTNEDCKII